VEERPNMIVHGFSVRRVCRLATLAVIAVATLVLVTLPALAEDAAKGAAARPPASQPGPLDLVKSSVSRAHAIVESQPDGGRRRAEIRQVGERLFDFNEMARRTLAQHWTERSPHEQEDFVRLFTDLLDRTYLTTVGSYRLETVTFHGESVEGLSARVRSRLVTDRGAKIPVEYRLLESAGRWAVYDVLVEGLSLISSYRSQFNSIIRTSSFAVLLERLRNPEPRPLSGRSERP
jgi:phospholipid transport system substrate-binding protein